MIKVFPQPEFQGQGAPVGRNLPPLPLRTIVLGPSGTGKTVVLVSMLLEQYRGTFSRIYVWSPSVWVDHTWRPVMQYSSRELGVDPEKDPTFFDEWDPNQLEKIIDQQMRLTEHAQSQRHKVLHQVVVVIDDFADRGEVMHRSGGVLDMLFARGRHAMISTIVASQKLRALSTMIRVNATSWVVFKLRNAKELQALLEELSAIYPPQILTEMYHRATAEKYSFWFVNLLASVDEMFWVRFERRLIA
jgi:Cdc6-like AAA superfamily ATPase